ncbi:MAG: transcriptional regulator [Sphingomonadales bacterium 32-64-17]|nr:MAG: transcriptional regulator [Sphingomonadales bacterium 32-64-17]
MNPAVTDAELDTITDVLKALAHELRLKLMRTLLENGEKSVGELESLTGIGQPALSQQLAVLRKAELVQTRREAKLVFYSLAPETLQDTAKLLCALSGLLPSDEPAGTKDAQARVRGSAATFARIL